MSQVTVSCGIQFKKTFLIVLLNRNTISLSSRPVPSKLFDCFCNVISISLLTMPYFAFLMRWIKF